jgi:hypothetical protein
MENLMAMFEFVREAGGKLFEKFTGNDKAKEHEAGLELTNFSTGLGLNLWSRSVLQ